MTALVALAAATGFSGPGAFTVALRIRPAPFAYVSNRAGMIASAGSGYYDGFRLEGIPTRRGLIPALEIGRTEGAWMLKSSAGDVLPPGTWSHLAAIWDGRIARIYLNGKVVAEGAYDGAYVKPRITRLENVQFATRDSFGLDYYPFERDDAKGFDDALSGADICALVGRIERPDPEAAKAQERLFWRTLGVWYDPSETDKEQIRSEWASRPCNPYGPWPVLPPSNLPATVSGMRFFVAPDGSDSNAGTQDAPFATLKAARDAIRAMKARSGLPSEGITVFLRGGTYAVKETLTLGEEDSGAPGSPILYAAWERERPVLSSGFVVRDFKPADSPRIPAAARGKVLVADIRAQGYGHFEPMPSYGFEVGEHTGKCPMTDLYCGTHRLEPARWPNEGWRKILGGDPTNNTVRIELDDWDMWTREPGLMITSYPSALWADLSCAVTGFDREGGQITMAGRPDGQRLSGIREGHPWFFSNALCALDAPGEWYLDREKGLLYVMPDGRQGPYVLSDFDGPFVELKGVHDVEFRGLSLAFGRGDAIVGSKLVRVTFAQNVIRNFGNDALHALDSEHVTIADNRLDTFGHGGIRLSGGDRKALTPAGHVVCGNDISRVEQWKRTYAPGLLLFGCGTRVERNHFHDMRSSAMRLEGNDFLIVSNLVEDVVLESDDQGGVDVYSNPTYAMWFVGNTWRNIGRGGEFVRCGQAAIRFDDRVSNMIVTGNRFENCSWKKFGAVQINCGRNNTIDKNVFVGGVRAASIQRMSMERWKGYVEGEVGRYRMVREVDIRTEPYRSHYPGIDRLPEMDGENRFWRNKLYGGCLPPPSHGGLTDLRANVVYEQ